MTAQGQQSPTYAKGRERESDEELILQRKIGWNFPHSHISTPVHSGHKSTPKTIIITTASVYGALTICQALCSAFYMHYLTSEPHETGYCVNFWLQMKMLWLSEVRILLKVTQPGSGPAGMVGFSSQALHEDLLPPRRPILLEHLLQRTLKITDAERKRCLGRGHRAYSCYQTCKEGLGLGDRIRRRPLSVGGIM